MSEPRIVNLTDIPWTPFSQGECAVEIKDPARGRRTN